MEKSQLVERAKLYMQLFIKGVNPVTGEEFLPNSPMMDEKIINCFSFISQILDEYLDYLVLTKNAKNFDENEGKKTINIHKKQSFKITREQCESIVLSKNPITILSFMKNINSVINAEEMEKISSTRITKWLTNRGFFEASKVQTVVNKTIYKPSDTARKIGIVEEKIIDQKSGEIKSKVMLGESAQLFILENIEDIIETT